MPAATTASAFGASRSIHSHVVIGWPVRLVRAQGRPVALGLDLLVGDRALDDQDERIEASFLGLIPELHELVAVLVGEHRVVEVDLGQPGNRPHQHVLDAGLRGGGDRHRVAVTAQAGRDPQDVEFLDGRRFLGLASVGRRGLRCRSAIAVLLLRGALLDSIGDFRERVNPATSGLPVAPRDAMGRSRQSPKANFYRTAVF